MARGDIHWFNRAGLDGFKKATYDLSTDAISLGIVNGANVPTLNTVNPMWGVNGTPNFSLDQVALGTGYTGPIALAAVTFTQVANIPTVAANSVVIPQDLASGFANANYGILYDNTHANKPAFAFLDLGGPVGNQNGPVNINWNSSAVSGPIVTTTAT